MLVIGLTGGIGSGKSTVSRFLAELGAVVLEADKVGHELLRPQNQAWHEIIATFGKGILKGNNEIDRQKLGELVFTDPEALARLNGIMHPRMALLMKERLEEWQRQGVKVAVLEAAVLFEAGWQDLVDQVWVTIAPREVILERLKKQKGLSEAQILNRLQSQMLPEEKVKRADLVIDTDGGLEELKVRVREAWEKLMTTVEAKNITRGE